MNVWRNPISRLSTGTFFFVAVACALTWSLAVVLSVVWPSAAAESPLLDTSLRQAVSLGWPPILALVVVRRFAEVDRDVDLGVRGVSRRWLLASILAALALVGAAAGRDALFDVRAAGSNSATIHAEPSAIHGLMHLTVFVVAVGVLWWKAFAEEVGWRGYLLAGLVRDLGSWRGLVVHGALWSFWYTPVWILGYGPTAIERLPEFLATFTLLGALLGWLRLRSGSILCSTAANATLTIAGGLPFFVRGAEWTRAPMYEPAGWPPLAVAFLLIVVLGISSDRGQLADRLPHRSDDG